MKRYAICALFVWGAFWASLEGNESVYLESADDLFVAHSSQAQALSSSKQNSNYPESAEDLPTPNFGQYQISRCESLSSIEEISCGEVSGSPLRVDPIGRLSDSTPHLSKQEVTGASSNSSLRSPTSSDSLGRSDGLADANPSSDSDLRPSSSSHSPRGSQKVSTDSDLKSSPSDSTVEEPSDSRKDVIEVKRKAWIQRTEPRIEEPSEGAYPLCSTNHTATNSPAFQQVQQFLNPLLFSQNRPVVVFVNANPSAPTASQTVSQDLPTQKPSASERPSLLSKEHKDILDWVNTYRDGPVAVEKTKITTGSLLSFGGEGMVSNTIRKFTKDPNFLGLSHVGIALVASANEALALIDESARVGGLYFFKNQMEGVKADMIQTIRNEFHRNMDKLDVFCLHSTGEMGVHIVPLHVLVREYHGSVFVRRLLTPLNLNQFLSIVVREIGKGYNFNINQLARCTRDGNKTEQNDKTFCSQLVAILYRDAGLLPPDVQANNVSPAEFDSRSPNDLLKDLADAEKVLKFLIKYTGGCCKCC